MSVVPSGALPSGVVAPTRMVRFLRDHPNPGQEYVAHCAEALGDIMGKHRGDAPAWPASLKADGWVQVTNPRPGDIGWSSPNGPYKGGGYGHVFMVYQEGNRLMGFSNGSLPLKPGLLYFRNPNASDALVMGTGRGQMPPHAKGRGYTPGISTSGPAKPETRTQRALRTAQAQPALRTSTMANIPSAAKDVGREVITGIESRIKSAAQRAWEVSPFSGFYWDPKRGISNRGKRR